MTHIRVNPESVQAYGRHAQAQFEQMHQSLVDLVNDVVNVQYFGPNAVAFKTECGQIAAAFAGALHLDMAAFADAVRASTSNIAAALGGAPIVIQLDNRAITPPTPATVDFVDVDTAALEALVPVVTTRFGALRASLQSNMNQLNGTDWQGNAKLSAMDAVASFTGKANTKCDQAETELNSFITAQVNSVVLADR